MSEEKEEIITKKNPITKERKKEREKPYKKIEIMWVCMYMGGIEREGEKQRDRDRDR